MDTLTLILFVVGLVFLVVGASMLVGGASALADRIGMSPLIIGLTVVSFGTSAPELAVTIQASWAGQAGVGVGNVVGSAVFNVLFILGLSALIAPLVVSAELLKRDGPVMIGAAILLLALALDHELSRIDGVVLFGILSGYIAWLIWRGNADSQTEGEEETEAPSGSWPIQLGRVIGGLILLVLGAQFLVDGAVEFAEGLGLSAIVVGLTIVAAGTGLPEVAASILATARGERELAVGSVVGSNIFNMLAVLGLAPIVSPEAIPVPQGAAQFDIPVFIAVAFASVLSFATGYQVSRWEGILFLAYYAAYTTYLILESTEHGAFGRFQPLAIVLGLLGLALLTFRAVRSGLAGAPTPAGQ